MVAELNVAGEKNWIAPRRSSLGRKAGVECMKAGEVPLVVGIILIGLGVFYSVWYPLHVRYDNPDHILLLPYVMAITSVTGGFVLVRPYLRSMSRELGLVIIAIAMVCLAVFFLTMTIHPHDL